MQHDSGSLTDHRSCEMNCSDTGANPEIALSKNDDDAGSTVCAWHETSWSGRSLRVASTSSGPTGRVVTRSGTASRKSGYLAQEMPTGREVGRIDRRQNRVPARSIPPCGSDSDDRSMCRKASDWSPHWATPLRAFSPGKHARLTRGRKARPSRLAPTWPLGHGLNENKLLTALPIGAEPSWQSKAPARNRRPNLCQARWAAATPLTNGNDLVVKNVYDASGTSLRGCVKGVRRHMLHLKASTVATPKCIVLVMIVLTLLVSSNGCSDSDEIAQSAPSPGRGADSGIRWPRLTTFYGRYVDLVLPVPDQSLQVDSLNEIEVVLAHGCDVTDDFITQLGSLPKLAVLDLRGSSVTDEQVVLIRKHCPLLRVLALGGCGISDASSEVLTTFSHLVVLDIGSTRLTDGAVQRIMKIETLALLAVGDRLVDDSMNLSPRRRVGICKELNEYFLAREPR